MNNIIRRAWNQNRMTSIEDLQGMAFQAESGGHTFEISGIDDAGETVELSGTVSGVFIRPDQTDVALTGTAEDGVVSVTLTGDCYAVAGRFGLTIFVTDDDDQKVAVYACVGTVTRTTTGAVAGSTPQDVVDLINAIEAAIATIPADYTDLMETIAPMYSDTALYAVGSYAWYDGKLYTAVVDIITAEAFNADHWTDTVVCDDLSRLIDTFKYTSVIKAAVTPVTGKFVAKNGTVSTSASYFYIEMDVQAGDTIPIFRAYYNGSQSIVGAPARFLCAYEGSTAVSSKGAENVTSYVVPEGITKIAVSFTTLYFPIADGYVPILRQNVIGKLVATDKKVKSVAFASMPQTVKGDLSASSSLNMTANSVKKNTVIYFYGKLGTFSKLTIGKGTRGDTNGEYVEITTTSVSIYRQNSAPVTSNHGLTFADYVSVTISIGQDRIPKITILTNGGSYTVTDTHAWCGDAPALWVESDASTALTDCALSWTCKDIDEPLWIFGDSYVSYAGDRWPYYAHSLGFDGYLLEGYSGATSIAGLQDLYRLLEYGTPRYLVWALGMNNTDSASAANAIWNSVYLEVKALCDTIGCQLVPCTIPNVPSISNVYKNAIVIASGLPYIDFASAVGALNGTTWYTGMLSSDNVHPTIEGAKALFAELVKDFPYVCVK